MVTWVTLTPRSRSNTNVNGLPNAAPNGLSTRVASYASQPTTSKSTT